MATIQVRMEGGGLTYIGDVPREKIGQVLAFLMSEVGGGEKESGSAVIEEVPKTRKTAKVKKSQLEGAAPKIVEGMFDEETFKRVRASFDKYGTSRDVADELNLPIEEVNRAVQFKGYGWYAKRRMFGE